MKSSPVKRSVKAAKEQYDANDPEIKVGQHWSIRDDDNTLLRRVRVLAPYPATTKFTKGRHWLFEDVGGSIVRDKIGTIGVFPEFNLRYVMTLEDE